MPDPGVQRSGAGVKSIASKTSDLQFQQALTKGLDTLQTGAQNFQANQQGSLGLASNLNLSAGSIPGGLAIAPSAPLAQPKQLGDEIIKQAGIEKIAELLGIGGAEKADEKEVKAEEGPAADAASKATPTQQTNKPVEQAQQSREEGRSALEQLFLDLINGKLNVQL